MSQFTEREDLNITKLQSHCLDVIENIYNLKRKAFIRQAIDEKLTRDIPRLRKYVKELAERTPFDEMPIKPNIFKTVKL